MIEHEWRGRPEFEQCDELSFTARDGHPPARLVLVVAHPDDESLIAGGLVHHASQSRTPTLVITATAGEASHPGSPTHSPTQLEELRRVEFERAVHTLHPGAEARVLNVGDGQVAVAEDELTATISELLQPRDLVISTWRHDGHPDHEAVARAVSRAAGAVGVRHLEGPLWVWAWQGPDALPWPLMSRWPLTAAQREAKTAALHCHVTQMLPLSADPRDAAVVPPEVVAHFEREWETFIEHPTAPPGLADVFDAMYDESADPWQFEGSWYEQRKRAVTMACLPDCELGRVLELGPATGLLTVELAARAESVLAVDISPRALQIATTRAETVGLAERVEGRVATLPRQWPEGVFDLVVISEVGYFMTPDDWRETLRRSVAALTPRGSLVLVHWRHPVDGWPMDGDDAHREAERLVQAGALQRCASYLDADFRAEVLARPGRRSVAAADGRC